MKTKKIITTGPVLVFSTDVPQNQIDAFANTMTKAQLDTMKVYTDPTTSKYFDLMISNLDSICWMVTQLGRYEHVPGPGTIKPIRIFADAMVTYIKKFVPFIPDGVLDPSNYLPEVISALRNPPADVEKALNEWWGAAAYTGSIHAFAAGPLNSMFGAPFVMLNYFSLDFTASSWHAMLDDQPSSQISVKSSSFMMLLNMITYNDEKDAIEAEIRASAQANINTTELSF